MCLDSGVGHICSIACEINTIVGQEKSVRLNRQTKILSSYIHVDDTIVAHRQGACHSTSERQEKLDKLKDQYIVKKANRLSACLSPLVVVPKKKKTKSVFVSTTVVKRERHSIPTVALTKSILTGKSSTKEHSYEVPWWYYIPRGVTLGGFWYLLVGFSSFGVDFGHSLHLLIISIKELFVFQSPLWSYGVWRLSSYFKLACSSQMHTKNFTGIWSDVHGTW